MSKWFDLLHHLPSQPEAWNQNSKTPEGRTDKTDKSPFGSFVGSHLWPFQIPHDLPADLEEQFGERAAVAEHDGELTLLESEHLALAQLFDAMASANVADQPDKPSDSVDA